MGTKKARELQRGFTIAELLVSIGVFSVVVSIAVGGLVNVLKTERQTAGLLAVNSNTSLILEQMAKEIRTGWDFCTNGQICPDQNTLSFKNSKGQVVTYCLANGAVQRSVSAGICGGPAFQKITADNIAVERLSFTLRGTSLDADQDQSRVTIAIGVHPVGSGVGTENVLLNLQASVSPRPLDYSQSFYQGSYQGTYQGTYQGYYQGAYVPAYGQAAYYAQSAYYGQGDYYNQGGYYNQGSYYSQGSYYNQGAYYGQGYYYGKGGYYGQGYYEGGYYDQGSYGPPEN